MKILNISKNTVIADKAELADTFSKRLNGLLSRKSLRQGQALILAPSNCIHSFFMRFTIDVLFLDKAGRVIGILPSFRPFRLSPWFFKSCLTVELPEFTIKQSQTQLGDLIKIEE
jgi:hypothetical protein